MSAVGPEPVSSELDRFELVGDARLEITGRWYGVRGRRFVRPSLTVAGGDGRSRALALLDHKPWAADDGAPWIAAFPWNSQDADLADAELAVAPDIAIALPGPTAGGAPTRAPHRSRIKGRPRAPAPRGPRPRHREGAL